MKRRTLIKGSILFIAGISFSTFTSPIRRNIIHFSIEKQLEEKVLQTLNNIEHPKAIGKIYLENISPSLNKADILSQISGSESYKSLIKLNNQQLKQWLAKRQIEDFAKGRIIPVQGWVLSETEVQIYALATLSET